MKSDIFTYGLVLHFMITGDKPWANEVSHFAIRGAGNDEGDLPNPPSDLGKGPLKDVYESCLQVLPNQRPSAAEIINKKFQGTVCQIMMKCTKSHWTITSREDRIIYNKVLLCIILCVI